MVQRTAAQSMGATAWAMLLALSVLWGGSFFFNGIAVHELPSFTIVWLRVAIGFAGLLLMLRISGERLPTDARVLLALLGLGLLNNVIPFTLIAWGQHRIPSGLAAVLNATTPLFGALAAHVLTRDEKLTPFKITGIAIGFAGVALLVGVDMLSGLGSGVAGEASCIAAAIAYALAAIYARRFRRMGVSPLVTATGQVGGATLLMLPLMLFVDQPWTLPMPHAATWFAILGSGLLATSLAFLLYFRIIASSGATNALLVTFLVPVSAIVLGALVLNEVLLPRHFAGMALIGAGLAFIDGRLPRRLLHRRGQHTAPGAALTPAPASPAACPSAPYR
jgi:drug/metabolite transporter (DMT)-like permease